MFGHVTVVRLQQAMDAPSLLTLLPRLHEANLTGSLLSATLHSLTCYLHTHTSKHTPIPTRHYQTATNMTRNRPTTAGASTHDAGRVASQRAIENSSLTKWLDGLKSQSAKDAEEMVEWTQEIITAT